jgi:hypothetical protein
MTWAGEREVGGSKPCKRRDCEKMFNFWMISESLAISKLLEITENVNAVTKMCFHIKYYDFCV